MKEKVVGTTFVEQKSFEELVGEYTPKEQSKHGVPEFSTKALLVPEPTNEYDPTAVAVMVQCKDGSAHRVGYLARTSVRKESLNGIIPVNLVIYGYSMIGMSDSFVIED